MKTTFGDGMSGGAASSAFNPKAADLKIRDLTEAMLQAFWRREHDTVESLARRGARFTGEMLEVSVHYQDAHLAQHCLDGGVVPNEDLMRQAVDTRSHPLVKTLLPRAQVTNGLRDHVSAGGTDAIRHLFGLPSAPVPAHAQPNEVPGLH